MLSNAELEKHLKKITKISTALSSVVAILSTLFVCFGFYYETSKTQKEHTESINDIKKDVVEIKNKVGSSEVYQGVSKVEYSALKEKVMTLEKTLERMDEKLDKVLFQTR